MQLVPDWRHVLKRAWSIRLAVASALFSGLEAVVWFAPDVFNLPTGWFAVLAFGTSAAATVARLVAQNGVTKHE